MATKSNPLEELLPAKVRQVLYAILFVALLAYTAWLAADGDWLKAGASLVSSLIPLLAAGNVSTGGNPPPGGDGELNGFTYGQLLLELEDRNKRAGTVFTPVEENPDE